MESEGKRGIGRGAKNKGEGDWEGSEGKGDWEGSGVYFLLVTTRIVYL